MVASYVALLVLQASSAPAGTNFSDVFLRWMSATPGQPAYSSPDVKQVLRSGQTSETVELVKRSLTDTSLPEYRRVALLDIAMPPYTGSFAELRILVSKYAREAAPKLELTDFDRQALSVLARSTSADCQKIAMELLGRLDTAPRAAFFLLENSHGKTFPLVPVPDLPQLSIAVTMDLSTLDCPSDSRIAEEATIAGRRWVLFRDGSLGFGGDEWVVERSALGEWGSPIFTGVCRYQSQLGTERKVGEYPGGAPDWKAAIPVIIDQLHQYPDGITKDLLQRLSVQEGNNLLNAWPNAPVRSDLSREEQIMALVFEDALSRDPEFPKGLATLTMPAEIRPFRLHGRLGRTLWRRSGDPRLPLGLRVEFKSPRNSKDPLSAEGQPWRTRLFEWLIPEQRVKVSIWCDAGWLVKNYLYEVERTSKGWKLNYVGGGIMVS